jgi:hypothetical protein
VTNVSETVNKKERYVQANFFVSYHKKEKNSPAFGKKINSARHFRNYMNGLKNLPLILSSKVKIKLYGNYNYQAETGRPAPARSF